MAKAVIVLENDPLARYAMRTSLENAGYAVIDGSSVEMVASMVCQRHSMPRVELCAVVVDCWLGRDKIDGITAMRRLEQVCGSGWRPVLITGAMDPDITEEAESAGLTLLRKPFRFDDLLAAVEFGQNITRAM